MPIGSKAVGRFRPQRSGGLVETPTLVLSLGLTTLTLLGATFHIDDSIRGLAPTVAAAIGALIAIAIGALLLYVVLRSIFRWIDGVRSPSVRPPHRSMLSLARPVGLPSALILAAPSMLWLTLHYPGNLTNDAVEQLLQWNRILPPRDHHPWFDTMLFGWFWDLGKLFGNPGVGIFIFLVLQVIAIACATAAVLTYMVGHGLPDRFRWGLVWAASLLPPFVMAPTVMSKDALATVFLIPTALLFVALMQTRGRLLNDWRVRFGGVALVVLFVLTKRTNVYLTVLSTIVLLVAIEPRFRRRLAIGVVMALGIAVFWWTVVLSLWGVGRPNNTDMFSIPVQQTARVVSNHGSEMSVSDVKTIDRMLGFDGLADAYDPRYSDPVKARFQITAPLSDRLAYAATWFRLGLRYPGEYAAATFNNTYELFAPITTLQYEMSVDGFREHSKVFRGKAEKNGRDPDDVTELVETIDTPKWLREVQVGLNRGILTFDRINPLNSKAFFASWVPLIAFTYAVRKRARLLAVAVFPSMLQLLVLIAGPVTFSRYITPMLYLAVLTVGTMLLPAPSIDPSSPRRHDPSDASVSPSDLESSHK